jgi:adenylate cyclase
MMPMFRDKPAAISVWISLLVFSVLLGLRLSGSLESLELTMYDWYIRLRPHVATTETRIALITITDMAWVIAAAGVSAYLFNREKEERHLLMQLFARHVSTEVADTIWQQRDEFLHGGRPRPQKNDGHRVVLRSRRLYPTVRESRSPNADGLDQHLYGNHGPIGH